MQWRLIISPLYGQEQRRSQVVHIPVVLSLQVGRGVQSTRKTTASSTTSTTRLHIHKNNEDKDGHGEDAQQGQQGDIGTGQVHTLVIGSHIDINAGHDEM